MLNSDVLNSDVYQCGRDGDLIHYLLCSYFTMSQFETLFILFFVIDL